MQITIEQLHQNVNNYLAQMHPVPNYTIGRSIVTSCYDKEFPSAWVLLNELKRLDVTLPIEVFYRDDELSSKQIDLLSSISNNVKVKKIKNVVKNLVDRYGHTQGWGTKVYAILESEYTENLWLDCDNNPIVNPEFLFNDHEYVQKGSLFWRDMYSVDSAAQYAPSSIMWSVFNVPWSDAEPFESGQFLINKNKCWRQLDLVKWYADNPEIYYVYSGDKETWRFAFQHLHFRNGGQFPQINYHSNNNAYCPYGIMPYGPNSRGKTNIYGKWLGGSCMCQRDREGHEIFNHRNINKFKLLDNVFNNDIQNEQYYHDHIKVLQEILKQ
jgi:hypothetical protein